jgi:transcriptional regulator with XRE-family HTH domain
MLIAIGVGMRCVMPPCFSTTFDDTGGHYYLSRGDEMPAIKGHKPVLSPLELRRRLALSQEHLSSLLRVSVKTISRWEKDQEQPRTPEQRARLAKLEEISELGQAVYTPEGLKEFLSTPLPVFAGHTREEKRPKCLTIPREARPARLSSFRLLAMASPHWMLVGSY